MKQEHRVARIISTIFYPGITGTIFTFILFLGFMGLNLKSLFSAIVYASLITLVPFLVIKRLVKQGKIGDREIVIKEQRSIFFKTSFPSYISAFVFLFLIGVPATVLLMGTGVMVFVTIYYLISPIYKISVHVGGLAFDIVATGLAVHKNFLFLLPLLPLLAWSRYKLKKHTWAQSFWGTIVGGGIPLIIYLLFIGRSG